MSLYGSSWIIAPPRGGQEVYTFWINQDIIVPVDEYKELLLQACRESSLNKKLYKG